MKTAISDAVTALRTELGRYATTQGVTLPT